MSNDVLNQQLSDALIELQEAQREYTSPTSDKFTDYQRFIRRNKTRDDFLPILESALDIDQVLMSEGKRRHEVASLKKDVPEKGMQQFFKIEYEASDSNAKYAYIDLLKVDTISMIEHK